VPSNGSRRPIYHPVRSAVSGDGKDLKLHYFIFEPASARRVAIELPAGFEPSVADGFVVGWSERRGQAFLLARTIGSKSAAVFRLDLSSGKLVKVIEESSPTRVETNSVEYHRVNIRVIGDGTELVWFSARSGWGHLYLYDAQSGALKHAITEGEWLALDIQALDEKRREIFFTGGGRERGRDPYFRLLYRASLDGRGAVTLLTPTDADHHFPADPSPLITTVFGVAPRAPLVKPEGGVFIDTSSTIDKAPVTELRSTRDGRVIATLERADASKLFQAGWRVPTRERVKAADGVTDLYAVYYAPYGDSKRARPVIDAVYGGPQVNVAPYNFHDVYASGNPIGAASLSRLGFAVVTVDGRGTTSRSRAFRDAGYTEFTRVGIEDHIAAIRELVRRHPEMDAGRVGIYGWSWGGTFSAQAILSHPEFYQVAVSGAGVYDYAASYPGFESYLGIPAYADGSSTRTRPDESPKNWEAMDITHMADRLQGHLMLVSGDQDENVPSLQAFRLIDALTRANKPYDLVFLPGRTHGTGMSDGYTLKRTWDYFVEHLAGATPVPDVVVKMRTAPAEL
jgi:dienelactone hydrolase